MKAVFSTCSSGFDWEFFDRLPTVRYRHTQKLVLRQRPLDHQETLCKRTFKLFRCYASLMKGLYRDHWGLKSFREYCLIAIWELMRMSDTTSFDIKETHTLWVSSLTRGSQCAHKSGAKKTKIDDSESYWSYLSLFRLSKPMMNMLLTIFTGYMSFKFTP